MSRALNGRRLMLTHTLTCSTALRVLFVCWGHSTRSAFFKGGLVIKRAHGGKDKMALPSSMTDALLLELRVAVLFVSNSITSHLTNVRNSPGELDPWHERRLWKQSARECSDSDNLITAPEKDICERSSEIHHDFFVNEQPVELHWCELNTLECH